MASAEFVWIIDPEVAFIGLFDWQLATLYEGILAIANHYAAQIEAWMKANAPWTDRTGNLRRSLHAWVDEMPGWVIIHFDYGLDYGVYLEFKNQGRYATIAPALDFFGPQIWSDIQALFA